MTKWKPYSLDFKQRAVERMRTCDNVAALARELHVPRNLLYIWKHQLEGRPDARRADLSQSLQSRTEQKLREENRLLKEALGEKSLEADFFAGALRRIKERRQNNTVSGATASTPKSASGHGRRKAN
jgi:transposase-like protein